MTTEPALELMRGATHPPTRADRMAGAMPWLFALLAVVILASTLPVLWIALTQDPGRHLSADYRLYMDATRSWLSSGSFYPAHQLAGPYPILDGDILYPPVALALFVPFTVLPAFLWWVIPVVGTAAMIAWHRPGPIAWPLMAICLAWEPTQIHLLSGNPGLWAMFAVALATRWPFAGPFVLLKPSLAPFALVGITHRMWWVGLAVFALLSLAFLPMWFDWLAVMRNGENRSGLLYSWQYAPMMLLPLIASWFSRRGGSPAARGSVLSRLRLSARASG